MANERTTENVTVRAFEHRDVPQLLKLMRGLAVFEGYIDEFTVTERDLVERGLGSAPQFHAQVAAKGEHLLGMAVGYIVPFTWNLVPTLVLKELYVTEAARGRGVGLALMRGIAKHGRRLGAGAMRWSVLAGNDRGARFYRGLGGRHDAKWEPWLLDGHDFVELADA